MLPTDADARAHVVLDDLVGLSLSPELSHHLGAVLRLRSGEVVTATDGLGAWRRCRFRREEGARRSGLAGLDPDGDLVIVAPPEVRFTVGFALTKGDKPELVVQKLTELGVDRIVAFVAERSVVLWDEGKAERNRRRWELVAREAIQQSRQVRLPEIVPVRPFGQVVAEDGPGLVMADRGGRSLDAALDRVVLIGPEGGWSQSERASATAVALGPTVLRAETAAIAAGVLLTAPRSRSGPGPAK